MDQRQDIEQADAGLSRIERQVERSQFFIHTALGEGFARIGEASEFVYGLIDLLLAKGVVEEGEVQAAVESVHQEMMKQGEFAGPGTLIRLEDNAESAPQTVKVDCSARLSICHAVCCKLNFALTIPEIESGEIKWDLGRPYQIRHEQDGYCSHLHRDSGACKIYASRPGVCRHYSCANDERIWKDFDKMELNTEWLSANLPPDAPERRVGMLMERPERYTVIANV